VKQSLWERTKANEVQIAAIQKVVTSDTWRLMLELAREAGLPRGEIVPADPNLAVVTHALKSCDRIGWNNCATFLNDLPDNLIADKEHDKADSEENHFGAVEAQIQAAPPSMREGLRKKLQGKQ
jgi:hypothetical protein